MINKETVLVKIYELRDPRDLECSPRYIGITSKALDKRLSNHLTYSKLNSSKNHKNDWIKFLFKQNIKPTIHLIEEVIGWDYACECEKYWIKEFKGQGCNLTNATNGGEGLFGFIYTEQQKLEKSLRTKGKNHPNYGKKLPTEVCLKISNSHKGKKITEIHKDNIRKSKIGVKLSEQAKHKLSIGRIGDKNPNYGKPMTKEHKEMLIKINKGSHHTEESKLKISESKNKFKIRIYEINENGEILHTFLCASEIAKKYNINRSAIDYVARNPFKKNGSLRVCYNRYFIQEIKYKLLF